MPKSAKKSCTAQTSISRYFNTKNPAEHLLSRGKVRSVRDRFDQINCTSDPINQIVFLLYLQQKLSSQGDCGLPAKRTKLPPQDHRVEEDLDCETTSCQSTKGECSKPSSQKCPFSWTFELHCIDFDTRRLFHT